MKRERIMILRSAILLRYLVLCAAIIASVQGQESMVDNYLDHDDRRHLPQAGNEEAVFDILTGEQIMPSTTTTDEQSPAAPAPTPAAFLEDGIISGTVYNDVNGNGQRDQASSSSSSSSQEEGPVAGVVVDLFNCDTGAQEGSTTTNSDGYYSLSIPLLTNLSSENKTSTSKSCYYIQFTVLDTDHNNNNNNNFDAIDDDGDTSVFTTPQNGETANIYLGRGEIIPNINAGILLGTGATPQDSTFTEWETTDFPTFAPSTSSAGMEEDGAAAAGGSASDGTAETSTSTSPTPNPTLPKQMTTTTTEPVSNNYDEGSTATAAASEAAGTTAVTQEGEAAAAAAAATSTTTTDEQDDDNVIHLRSSVRLQLSNVRSRMKRDALFLFESECATFLNSQLQTNNSTTAAAVVVPPLHVLNCNVLRQDMVQHMRVRRLRRRLRRSQRFLAETNNYAANESTTSNNTSSLILRVRVIGRTAKSSSVQDAADVKFRDVLVRTFDGRGSQFSDALKEESALRSSSSSSSSTESSSETAEFFDTVGTIASVVTSEVDGGGGRSPSGVQKSTEGNNDNDDDGAGNKGIVAAIVVCIVVGSVIWAGLFTLVRRQRKEQSSNQSTELNNAGSTGGGTSNVGAVGSDSSSPSSGGGMALFKSFPRSVLPRFNTDSPPCTPPSNITASSSFSPNSMCSHVGSDGEVEIVEDDDDGPEEAHPDAPVRRDVMAPPGTLGLLVSGDANTIGYGPAVRTIQPGSPMEGLIHVEDRIVAINDVDTREFSAEDIIQVMADTSGSERKITVLSDQP